MDVVQSNNNKSDIIPSVGVELPLQEQMPPVDLPPSDELYAIGGGEVSSAEPEIPSLPGDDIFNRGSIFGLWSARL